MVPRPRRALVIEGGGMKAAYANGVLTSFEREGYHPWDAVVGTSAGGAMAAWYAAGQAEFAEGTWAYAADPRILSYRRGLTGGPILDHEALWQRVYLQEHPLDQDAVARAPFPVIVTAADTETGEVVYPDIRKGDMGGWIRATGRLPFGAGPAVEVAGRTYVDGGVIDPIPIRHAVEHLGATDVTLIANKPPGPKKADPRLLIELAARRYPALRDGMLRHQQIKEEAMAYAADPPPGVTVHRLWPSQDTGVSRMSRDLARIEDALRLGHRDGAAFVARQRAASGDEPVVVARPQ